MFRKLTFILLILTLLPIGLRSQDNPPLAGVVMGSATATQNFDKWSGGIQLGFETSLDQLAGVSMRTLYTRWKFGDPNLQTIRTNVKWDWYGGNKFCFYLLAGIDAWIDGNNRGADLMTGVGLGWDFYTAKNESYLIPFKITLLTEIIFADADLPTDNTGQINVGLRFTRPIKK